MVKPLKFECNDGLKEPLVRLTPIMASVFTVEGNIGSGKTTLLSELEALPQGFFTKPHRVIFEPVEDWMHVRDDTGENMLVRYYQDPKKYGFTFQMMALASRCRRFLETVRQYPDHVLILERSIYTDSFVFAKMLKEASTLSAIEWHVYQEWFQLLEGLLPNDLSVCGVVYLTALPETCMARVQHRGREGEHTIALDYLQQLHSCHQQWLSTTPTPVLHLDDTASAATRAQDIARFVDQVLQQRFSCA